MRSASKKKLPERMEPALDREQPRRAIGNSTPDLQNDNLLQALLDAIEDGVSVHSVSGDILYANTRMLEILGKTGPEVIGKTCDEIFHDSACPHEQALQTKSRVRLEGRIRRGDCVLGATIAPMTDKAGRVTGFVRTVREIGGTARAQEELIRAEHLATLGQMISGIAHDIGTPLNIISGYSEYLLMRAGADGKGQKELLTIIQQTRRIADFIKQMLDLARPAQGRRDAIELKGFLADTLELMGSHLRKINVKWSLECKAATGVIYGDGPRLRQAIFNLIINAAQSLGSGGEIEIAIDEQAQDEGFAQVTIFGKHSDGTEEDLSASFSGLLSREPRAEAAGMGLALASEILSEIGAGIRFSARGGAGTGLILLLPKGNNRLH